MKRKHEDLSSDEEVIEKQKDEEQEAEEQEDEENEVDEQEENDKEENNALTKKTQMMKNQEKPRKKKKKGIIYLSTIPKHMTVTIAREILGQYDDIGRVFLQPITKPGEDNSSGPKKKKRRQARHFSEGWIEFESKRAAKEIAKRLNNTPIATRKSSKFYDISWTIKYLPRFKWVHLSERLTYEKAVFKQKMQAEISQARKEAAFFQENLDKSDKNKRLKKKAKLNK